MHRDIASMVPLQLLPCIVGLQPASHRVCSYFCNNCSSDTGTRNRCSISSCIVQSIPCSIFMQRSLHGPTLHGPTVAASKAGVVITSIVAARSVASLPRGPVVIISVLCSICVGNGSLRWSHCEHWLTNALSLVQWLQVQDADKIQLCNTF